jgi:hypothetical protein
MMMAAARRMMMAAAAGAGAEQMAYDFDLFVIAAGPLAARARA